jgi:multiple sugar transport system ATP-binding protein
VDAVQVGETLSAQGVTLPINDAQRAALQAHGQVDWVYGLRPESISFVSQGVPGKLSMIEPTGPETYATVETAAGKLTARVPGVLQAVVGDTVHLQWSADSAHVFDRASGSRVG